MSRLINKGWLIQLSSGLKPDLLALLSLFSRKKYEILDWIFLQTLKVKQCGNFVKIRCPPFLLIGNILSNFHMESGR